MRIRLDKYLADLGIETRSGAKSLIKRGHVTVNGITAAKPDMKIDTDTDTVCYDDAELSYHQFEYFMLHKPAGIISASNDDFQETVVDLVTGATRHDLFPVGRLDKDTTGLLLITNDGKLAHELLSPKHHVDKIYEATLDRPATKADAEAFATGIDIGDDTPTLPATLELLCEETASPDGNGADTAHAAASGLPSSAAERPESSARVRVTIHEGRYHQIKRMFEARGKLVVQLKRLSMGPLMLDPTLKEGQSRPLTEAELEALRSR